MLRSMRYREWGLRDNCESTCQFDPLSGWKQLFSPSLSRSQWGLNITWEGETGNIPWLIYISHHDTVLAWLLEWFTHKNSRIRMCFCARRYFKRHLTSLLRWARGETGSEVGADSSRPRSWESSRDSALSLISYIPPGVTSVLQRCKSTG